MTHNDIYTKFMIEYDKANVTSSYPSLTEYEVATILDKAYNALIAQKVTGNNVRRSPFESDIKSISDLQPLIISDTIDSIPDTLNYSVADLPDDFLYFVSLNVQYDRVGANIDEKTGKQKVRLDGLTGSSNFAKLVDHNTASKFLVSRSNIPWVKEPVCYIEENMIYVILDPSVSISTWSRGTSYETSSSKMTLTYIKQPEKFMQIKNQGTPFSKSDTSEKQAGDIEFECNSTVAEELISLAISFALENVESPRLNTKLNMRGLES